MTLSGLSCVVKKLLTHLFLLHLAVTILVSLTGSLAHLVAMCTHKPFRQESSCVSCHTPA